jgi:transposase
LFSGVSSALKQGRRKKHMHQAFRFRLYPIKKQAMSIHKSIGSSRFVFNHFLAKRKYISVFSTFFIRKLKKSKVNTYYKHGNKQIDKRAKYQWSEKEDQGKHFGFLL